MFQKYKYRLLVVALILFGVTKLSAQGESYGTWTDIEIQKDFGKLNIGAETELRTIYDLRLIERWSIGMNASYQIIKPIKVGIGYEFMNNLDTKYFNYQFRNRLNAFTSGKLKFDHFTFLLKEKLQVTYKDDSKRIKDDGTIDTYKINPEWEWRNKLSISYNIPKCRITPLFSVESFYELNDPDGNNFDNLRYTLEFSYKINKRNYIEVFGLINSAINSSDECGKYILGVGYNFSF